MVGMLLCFVLQKAFDIEISKLVRSIINLTVAAFGAFYLFPKIYHTPFSQIPLKEYLKRLGVYWPREGWRHVLLGVVLALCTLSAMLAASLLSGRYVLDWSAISLDQFVFSLAPGIFEEIFYRGIIAVLLFRLIGSWKKALIGQILIFGLAHFKGLGIIDFVEIISVMVIAVAFTYAAYKTQALLAGIVFHYLHDSLLFFVQPPGAEYIGLQENVVFYALLWLMVGFACGIIWFASERLQIRGEEKPYEAVEEAVLAAEPAQ